jgi:starch synthase
MKILHLSAECYPAAKAGGLGDVVGSLPKYLNQQGAECMVLIPKYDNSWFRKHSFKTVHEASARLSNSDFKFRIQKLKSENLGFPFYCVDIPGRFDRPGIYIDPWSGHGYWDELERNICFQIAALDWIRSFKVKPDVIHCHDHQTGLVPFMTRFSFVYEELKEIPTILTVHNAEYHGVHDMGKTDLLPHFDDKQKGMLEWAAKLNSLAAGIKCAWQVTTVSENYMTELSRFSSGLEYLFASESQKSKGILNGIDVATWDPRTDEFIAHNYSYRNRKSGKEKNKKALCEEFKIDPNKPTIAFIGRLVREKGADLIPDLVRTLIHQELDFNFIILGTGDPQLQSLFAEMNHDCVGYFDSRLEYNERLAHQIYAGADFIFMPSRVEPCGLNQMFAMRYGTVPIVRTTGGLKDTVKDLDHEDGYGIRFDEFALHEAEYAVKRALELYGQPSKMAAVISEIMKLDFSWEKSAKQYLELYHQLVST